MSIYILSALVMLDIGLAVSYLVAGDYARMVYWIAACTLTLSTLYIK